MRPALLIAMLLVVITPASAAADTSARSVSVSPAEVSIDNLSPGVPVDFDLTIHNEEGLARVFVLTVYQPPEDSRRAGREELPDERWIGFSQTEVEVGAESEASVRVTVAVPQEQALTGKDWEVWLGVSRQSGELLTAKCYVRLLISTRSEAACRVSMGLVVGAALAALLLGYGFRRYLRRRTSLTLPSVSAGRGS